MHEEADDQPLCDDLPLGANAVYEPGNLASRYPEEPLRKCHWAVRGDHEISS